MAGGAKETSDRLDLLYEAANEVNAQRYDQAVALLDRRAKTFKQTGLDWMLRARIAEAQGRLGEAVEYLKHIDDSDPVSAQAWLKTGQIEIARHRAGAAERAFAGQWPSTPTSFRLIASWPTSTHFNVARRSATHSFWRWLTA